MVRVQANVAGSGPGSPLADESARLERSGLIRECCRRLENRTQLRLETGSRHRFSFFLDESKIPTASRPLRLGLVDMIQRQHHGVPVLGLQLLHRLLDSLHVASGDVGPRGGIAFVHSFDQAVQLIEAE
jgi:hypothetical protein